MIANIGEREFEVEILEEGDAAHVAFLGGESFDEIDSIIGDGVLDIACDDGRVISCSGVETIALIRARESDFWTGKRVVAVLRKLEQGR